ncbi:MAG: 4'-phosphopantetheinyl transferase superfamily protein [Oscillospiraceae bacterium]|nr:4'-phosphopantetheinyl transferase superfamily protein [Oscillospiraceae bacterium]
MELQLVLCRTDHPFFDANFDVNFDANKEEIQNLFTEEARTALSRRHQREQQRSAAGHWLLGQLLRRFAPEVPLPPRLEYGWQDKPFLADCPTLHFNLSHSGNWAACVLSSVPVGVDIQEKRKLSPALIRKFSHQEQEWLGALSDAEREDAVMNLWCLKEAYCKCTGDGLRTPLSATTFTLRPLSVNQAGYSVCLPDAPEEDYFLAVCVQSDTQFTVNSVVLTPPKGI